MALGGNEAENIRTPLNQREGGERLPGCLSFREGEKYVFSAHMQPL